MELAMEHSAATDTIRDTLHIVADLIGRQLPATETTQKGRAMTSQSSAHLVKAMTDAMTSDDVDGMVKLFAPGGVTSFRCTRACSAGPNLPNRGRASMSVAVLALPRKYFHGQLPTSPASTHPPRLSISRESACLGGVFVSAKWKRCRTRMEVSMS
jgi:hypothetical protein